MSFIELHPELTQTNAQLRRIANALEQLLLQQFGYRTAPVDASERIDEKDEVMQTTDLDQAKQQFERLVLHRRDRQAEEEVTYASGDDQT